MSWGREGSASEPDRSVLSARESYSVHTLPPSGAGSVPVRSGIKGGLTGTCGQHDNPAELGRSSSEDHGLISSKLATRVRFPSPAPITKAQVNRSEDG